MEDPRRRRPSVQPPCLLSLALLLLLLTLAIPCTVAATTTKEESTHKRFPLHKKHRHAAHRRTPNVNTPEAKRDLSAKHLYIQSLSSETTTAPAQTFALKVGGVRFDDNICSIAVDADGVTYVLGEFSSPTMSMGGIRLTNVGTTNLADSIPLSDLFLARIGRGGVLDWVQGWGGPLNEFAGDLVVDSTGTKLFVVGGYESGEFNLGPAEVPDTTALYRDAPGMDDDYVDDDEEEEEEGAEKVVGSTMFFAEVDARTGVVTWAYEYGDGKCVAVATDEVQVCISRRAPAAAVMPLALSPSSRVRLGICCGTSPSVSSPPPSRPSSSPSTLPRPLPPSPPPLFTSRAPLSHPLSSPSRAA